MANLTTCGDGHTEICWDWRDEGGCPLCAAKKEMEDAVSQKDAEIGTLEGERNDLKATIEDLTSKIDRMENDRC